jgi:hypothetical protein
MSFTGNDAEDDYAVTVVRRPVYDAAMKLRKEVESGARGPEFEIARAKRDECRAAGDAAGAGFWQEVFDFEMTREGKPDDAKTVILEEGESWDDEEEKVIRPGKNRPRRNKGS